MATRLTGGTRLPVPWFCVPGSPRVCLCQASRGSRAGKVPRSPAPDRGSRLGPRLRGCHGQMVPEMVLASRPDPSGRHSLARVSRRSGAGRHRQPGGAADGPRVNPLGWCANAPWRWSQIPHEPPKPSQWPLTPPDRTRRLSEPVAATGGGIGSRDGPDLGGRSGGRPSIRLLDRGQKSRDAVSDGGGVVPSPGRTQFVLRFALRLDHHLIAVPETGRGAPVP
jgi:hypothetical protein